MTVFKNYFKVLKKYKLIIILYTIILLVFTIFTCRTNNSLTTFTAKKPNIAIVNLDEESKIVKNIYKYIEDFANLKEIENDEEKIADSIFYEDINAVIYIYDGYTNDFLNNKEKNLNVKFGVNSSSQYAKMLLEKYFQIADIVNNELTNEEEIIELINETLEKQTTVTIQNTLDIDSLEKASMFFNFSNYTILSICIYVTAVIITKFNNEKIKKRNMISSTKTSSITFQLYLGSFAFVFIVWLVLILISIILIGKTMLTLNGLLLILNSFVFMTCGLSIGILTGNITKSENVVNAIVNVFALGSTFVCGGFLPAEFLPKKVVKFSKCLPSYWFVSNNNMIKSIEVFNLQSILPLGFNMVVMFLFSILFFVMTIIVVNRKK